MRLMKRSLLLATLSFAASTPALAQTDTTHSLWSAWFNSAKINESWSFISDVQARSADEVDSLRNVLIRPGLSYALSPSTSISAGYAFIGTYSPSAPDTVEHRLWQQLIHNHSLAGNKVAHRFRLEQRQIERVNGGDIHSDRLRYFTRMTIPLEQALGKNYYAAVQNEVFLNLSNKEELNNQVFDQNRAYIGVGKRINPTVSVELGYMNQYINGRTNDTLNHAIQASLSTTF